MIFICLFISIFPMHLIYFKKQNGLRRGGFCQWQSATGAIVIKITVLACVQKS
jgi:hypothetical protein